MPLTNEAKRPFYYPVLVKKEASDFWVDRVRYVVSNGQHYYVRDKIYSGPTDNHTVSFGVLTGSATLLFGKMQD